MQFDWVPKELVQNAPVALPSHAVPGDPAVSHTSCCAGAFVAAAIPMTKQTIHRVMGRPSPRLASGLLGHAERLPTLRLMFLPSLHVRPWGTVRQ
jgi:hypothetical protein